MSQIGIIPAGGGGGGGVLTIAGDIGGQRAPLLGNINLVGGSNINTSGAGNSITINLNNAVSVTGNITSTTGDITSTLGSVYGYNITTNTSPGTTLTMQDNGLFAGGTDPNVDVSFTTQGLGAVVIDCIAGGALNSQWRTAQDEVQTTDATQTIIAFINLPVKTMVTVNATINGYKSTYDQCIGGTIYFSAYRPAAGDATLIGMIQSNPAKSNGAAATVTIDGSVDAVTQTVRLEVTGAAAETWNWVTTYSYMFTLNP